jgi:hypothetical protein
VELVTRLLRVVALVEALVEVAPVTAFDGSGVATFSIWANMSTLRIH